MKKIIETGILTISDRCARGIYEDKSGPALRDFVEKKGWSVVITETVPDEKNEISDRLIKWCDQLKLNLILTTGGTGLGPRDVTPEATQGVLHKELPGFSELMRREGQAHTPLAPLSRSLSGVREKTLLVNLPGNPEGAVYSLRTVEHLIPHALKMIHGEGHESRHSRVSGNDGGKINMKQPAEALDLILQTVRPLKAVTVSLSQCVGYVLAADIFASENIPPFDNSAMDGFAVRAEDLRGAHKEKPIGLPLQDTSRAGTTATLYLKEGHVIKIMTGAPLPQGANTIAIKEVSLAITKGHVEIVHEPKVGDHIRRAGEDVKVGDPILSKGNRIRPYDVALLASQGITKVPVIGKPRVRVIATGDELVEPAEAVSFGKIRNSNGPSICASLKRWGIEPTDSILVRDNPDELELALHHSLLKNDVILISGGVSVGDFDYTKEILEKMGAQIIFWKVAIKPGKPLLFATLNLDGETKYIFGLPGNPVSALVCLEEFVRGALEKLQGYQPQHPSYHLKGRVINFYAKPLDRQQYIFCQVEEGEEGFNLKIIRPQGSALMGMASRANALALGPIGISRINEGDVLSFRWLK